MEVSKKNVGKYFYIVETKQNMVIVHYGELISILPKYMFLDKFNSKYSREQTFLFKCKKYGSDGFSNITTSSSDFIFDSFKNVCDYINDKNVVFGASVIIKEKESNTNESKI